MTTLIGRAGDTITITGRLKYDLKYLNVDGYIFLEAEDGKMFNVTAAPASAITVVKTAFEIGDHVRKQYDATPGEVKAIVNNQAFVLWSTGFATAEEFDDLKRHVEEPRAQIDIEEYLAPVQPPLSPAQVAEIEREAEASELPDVSEIF